MLTALVVAVALAKDVCRAFFLELQISLFSLMSLNQCLASKGIRTAVNSIRRQQLAPTNPDSTYRVLPDLGL